MKTIGLKEAHRRLKQCPAVIVDNDALVYLKLGNIHNIPENQFIFISGDGEDRDDIRCIERNNQTIKVTDDGSLMFLEDRNGFKCQLTLLQYATFETYEETEEDRMAIEQALEMLKIPTNEN